MAHRAWTGLIFCAAIACSLAGGRAQAFDHFITAKNGMLIDGDKPFRFISYNVPNLNYIEDDMQFRQEDPYRLPDEFEMRDVFATINQSGGRVVRIYTIPVKNNAFPPGAPTYVLAPNTFNEDAFRTLDKMMALANQYGVRIIFPLVNNWPWMGGRPQYAAFRGKKPDAFWTDPQLIADFEATIRHLLERTNTITGVKYKDDKAILCWETGNELSAPFSWTVQITRYIKSLDRNHLVMDGSRGDISNKDPSVQKGALSERSIDIVTTHHYEADPGTIPGHIADNVRAIHRRKVYIIGEFGFAPTAANKRILDEVIAARKDIAGALIWSLRFHDRDGGYYWHSEPAGGDLYKAFYWPGSPAGEAYDDTRMVRMMREEAYAIRGELPPPIPPPAAPTLLPIANAAAISWQGSVGASGYDIERATSAAGPWEQVGYNASDADVPYFPLFNDTKATIGDRYFYRVIAVNAAGASPPSNVVGPVDVTDKVMIDTMKNLGLTQTSHGVVPTTGSDRSFKEVRNRLAGDAGAEMIYMAPGRLRSFDLYDFEQAQAPNLQLLGSPDGIAWSDLDVIPTNYSSGETNYKYWVPKVYHVDNAGSVRFIKIEFKGAAQLARAELAYTNK